MSFWFVTEKSLLRTGAQDGSVIIPSGGLPDLSRALSADHLREWVKHVHAEAAPEEISLQADYYWKLISQLQQDDYVLAAHEDDKLALGEIDGAYHFEPGPAGGHVWPVRWKAVDIPLREFEALRPMLGTGLKEMPTSEAHVKFRKYIPSWQTRGYLFFRWISVILLVTELIYFWPKGK